MFWIIFWIIVILIFFWFQFTNYSELRKRKDLSNIEKSTLNSSYRTIGWIIVWIVATSYLMGGDGLTVGRIKESFGIAVFLGVIVWCVSDYLVNRKKKE